MKSARLVHIFLTGFTALFVFALLPQSGFAREPVDPIHTQPASSAPIQPGMRKGGKPICTVQFSDPPFAGGSGVICGTGANTYEVFQFQNRSVQGKRYYDENGNLTRRLFTRSILARLATPSHTKQFLLLSVVLPVTILPSQEI